MKQKNLIIISVIPLTGCISKKKEKILRSLHPMTGFTHNMITSVVLFFVGRVSGGGAGVPSYQKGLGPTATQK